jgi:hypothetical protein
MVALTTSGSRCWNPPRYGITSRIFGFVDAKNSFGYC